MDSKKIDISNIKTYGVNRRYYYEIAKDEVNNVYLVGILKDHGGASITEYYKISQHLFDESLSNIDTLNDQLSLLEKNELYYSPIR